MSVSFSQELVISTLLVVLFVPLYLYLRRCSSRSKNPIIGHPTNWPILYMLPSLLANLHNLHEYLTVVLAGSGHSFRAHGPPGSGLRFFFTCDPENVRHIFTTNYGNYPKGEDFAAIFDIMSGSFFTVDGEHCSRQRAKIKTLLSNPQLISSMAARCRHKVESGLLPLFTRMASTCALFDVQEVFARLMFDLTATTVFGVDPGFLSSDMPRMDALAAMDTVMKVAFIRQTMPASCWKAMRWLNIGHERKLHSAQMVLRDFVVKEMMDRKKIITAHGGSNVTQQEGVVDLLSSYINDPDYTDNNDFLYATLINLMIAGRDTVGTTLPWIVYNLAKYPSTLAIIRNELSHIASHKVANNTGSMVVFEPDETRSLVYLRAALYETLRLYPPGHIERKTVAVDDIMPSGHEVRAGDTIFISLYSMGRMEGVWGKNCLDYNPERWLSSEDGEKLIRYVPSDKFLAFNSGPRMCLGKEIAIMQMKTIIATLVWNFDMEVMEGQRIEPKLSCILQIRNGLALVLKKREM